MALFDAVQLVMEIHVGSAQPGSACQMENYNGAVKTNKNKKTVMVREQLF